MPSYPEIFNGPPRSYKRDSAGRPVTSRKRYITIHNTSNDASAEGEASYAKTRTDGTSSHYYVDDNSIVQSLNTDWCAGHVGSLEGNTYGISYEITGVNGWTRAQWLANVAWDLLSAAVARDCTHFGIPVRRLSIAEMQAKNQAGFITHNDARIAWGATTHTDPGPGFPMDHLLALVDQHLNGDDDMGMSDTNADILIARVDGLTHAKDNVSFGPQVGEPIPLVRLIKAQSAVLEAIAKKVDLDPAELDKLKAAAEAGAKAGVIAGAQQLAEAIAEALKGETGLTAAEAEVAAERAVRRVLGGLDAPTVTG